MILIVSIIKLLIVHWWKYITFFWTNFYINPGWVSFYDVFDVNDGDFFNAWKFTIDWGISFDTEPIVPLKLEEDDEDRVVIGEGISFVILVKRGALGLLYRLAFLFNNFFFP